MLGSPEVVKAATMMAVALPTMFAVIVVFYAATKALHRLFPAPPPEPEEDAAGAGEPSE